MKFVFIAKHRAVWPEFDLGGRLVSSGFIESHIHLAKSRILDRCKSEKGDLDEAIERLMRLQGLRARPRRRRLPKDSGDRQLESMPANLLDRRFVAERPNQKWIADFTYLWTAEGWLYVAAVIDLFSRQVVGWSMSAAMTAQLVTDALLMAVWRRGKPDALLHHSDQAVSIRAISSSD